MTLPTKTIAQFVSDMQATFSGQTGFTGTFSSGNTLLAWWQSVSVQLDYIQAQVQIVLALARAQTSTGADLDSWMAQFNFFRLPATFASGQQQFSNAVAAATQINIPVGTVVQTVGGSVQYQLVADSTQSAYSSSLNAYVLPAGQTSVFGTVQALVGGSSSNVLASTLIQFGTNAPGISTTTNPEPITNGVDAETDAAFRSRFVLYLATLAKATKAAILAAAQSVQQGLLINLLENEEPDGTPLLGSFTVIVDDGSGDPPLSLLNSVFAAVDAVRAFSVQPFVSGPTQFIATISLMVHVTTGATAAAVITAVQNAVAAAVNDLAPGQTLYVSTIFQAAIGVANVAAVGPVITINGTQADLVPSAVQEVRTTVGNVTVGTY